MMPANLTSQEGAIRRTTDAVDIHPDPIGISTRGLSRVSMWHDFLLRTRNVSGQWWTQIRKLKRSVLRK
jgi:hypothetical protein